MFWPVFLVPLADLLHSRNLTVKTVHGEMTLVTNDPVRPSLTVPLELQVKLVEKQGPLQPPPTTPLLRSPLAPTEPELEPQEPEPEPEPDPITALVRSPSAAAAAPASSTTVILPSDSALLTGN